MTGPSGRDVRLAFEAATMDLRGFVQLTRQVRPCPVHIISHGSLAWAEANLDVFSTFGQTGVRECWDSNTFSNFSGFCKASEFRKL